MTNDEVQRIVKILDGYFRYTLEMRLDEDIPAAAADIAALFADAGDRTARQQPTNDIDAAGHCCCAGCIGVGPCDLDSGQSDDDRDDDEHGPMCDCDGCADFYRSAV